MLNEERSIAQKEKKVVPPVNGRTIHCPKREKSGSPGKWKSDRLNQMGEKVFYGHIKEYMV
ncbi:MAG: hypothetical protein K6T88_17635 [Bacillus sp. (in: Bacteria)]|nr:hypothetical protein [Bacillus sp. (in: firmicutes)]